MLYAALSPSANDSLLDRITSGPAETTQSSPSPKARPHFPVTCSQFDLCPKIFLLVGQPSFAFSPPSAVPSPLLSTPAPNPPAALHPLCLLPTSIHSSNGDEVQELARSEVPDVARAPRGCGHELRRQHRRTQPLRHRRRRLRRPSEQAPRRRRGRHGHVLRQEGKA